MATRSSDADVAAFVPFQPRSTNDDIELQQDTKKVCIEHVENVSKADPAIDYVSGEEHAKPRTGLRRLLKRNPSVEFVREVAELSATEGPLDPKAVRTVEKRIRWLIVPALFVCYGEWSSKRHRDQKEAKLIVDHRYLQLFTVRSRTSSIPLLTSHSYLYLLHRYR
jgi:hypothetical protein